MGLFHKKDDYKNKYYKLISEIQKILYGETYSYQTDEYLLKKIKELKEINKQNKEKDKEIYELKIQLREEKSEWKQRGNAYPRWNSKQKEIKDLKNESIKTWEDMKDYMINNGVSPDGYMKKMGIFLLNLKGDKFTIEEINEAIDFNNRKTRRSYIKKFIELDLIEDTKIKGVNRKKFKNF
jgi:hypothetical protein